MLDYETQIELCGESIPAIVEYDIDDEGITGICISSVRIKKCTAERGSLKWLQDGSYYRVHFPEYILLELFPFLNGKQLKGLAEEIYAFQETENWHEVMNEPRYFPPRNIPHNFPGVRL